MSFCQILSNIITIILSLLSAYAVAVAAAAIWLMFLVLYWTFNFVYNDIVAQTTTTHKTKSVVCFLFYLWFVFFVCVSFFNWTIWCHRRGCVIYRWDVFECLFINSFVCIAVVHVQSMHPIVTYTVKWSYQMVDSIYTLAQACKYWRQ